MHLIQKIIPSPMLRVWFRTIIIIVLTLFTIYSLLEILSHEFPSLTMVTPHGTILLPQPYILGMPLIQAVTQVCKHGIPALLHMNFAKSFGYDFAFFDYAFRAAWFHHGHGLYDITAQRIWMHHLRFPLIKPNQYVYPPQFAVLLSPLALLPFRMASLVWGAAGFIFTFLSALCLAAIAANGRQAPIIKSLIIAMVVGYYGVFEDLFVSNTNWLILFLLSLFFYLYVRHQKRFTAGITLGLAIVFKVTPIMILIYFLLRKEWRLFWGTLTSIAITTLITIWGVGWSPIGYYVTHIGAMSAHSMLNGPAPYNLSIIGLLQLNAAWHNSPMSHWPVAVLFYSYVLIMMFLFWISMRKENNWRYDMALSSINVVAFSPLIEGTHTIVLLITFTALIADIVAAQTHIHAPKIADSTNRIAPWMPLLPIILLGIVIVETSMGLLLLINNYVLPMWWPFTWTFWTPFTLYTTFFLVFTWPWLRQNESLILHPLGP